ncbi:MAG: YajD family HNH nuclease [Gammaproteobacteria bacterium]|nr:YajD family HNH nuclease [Gammaproteobacteria bacterium]
MEARRNAEQREKGYREQALKLYPWICGRCSREFNRDNLRELTIHHRDHNHDNNPVDGSNWELLCVYCHDNEHQRLLEASAQGGVNRDSSQAETSTFKPFAGLEGLLKDKK